MKKYSLIILLAALAVGLWSCDPKPALGGEETNTLSSIVPSLQVTAGNLPDSLDWHIEVVETNAPMAKGVQSFGAGHHGSDWLFVGGRTNGFHLTFSDTRTFPTLYSNEDFIVYNVDSGTTATLAIPSEYKVRLRASNMEYFQDGNTLYVVGGYGSTCDADNNSCYITMPYITAIDVPGAISAVTAGDSVQLAQAIVSLEDDRMQVTGGLLRKVGDYFYLVFGQDYRGKYKSGLNGTYTEQIARFTLSQSGDSLRIGDYTTYTDPDTTGFTSQYHRRDLNVTETIFADGNVGLSVWGGVFTIEDNGWPNPIYINPGSGDEVTVTVDTAFELKCNYYESGHVEFYSPSQGVMYTTILGGISNWFYEGGILVPGTQENALPFTNIITTLGIGKDGTREYVQPEAKGLPALIGSNAEFFPSPTLPIMLDTHGVIDLDQLTGNRTLIGHMAGGIRSTAAQTNGINPTFANEKVYEVYLVRD